MTDRATPTQYIFRRHGERVVRGPVCEPTARPSTPIPTIADCVLATSIMSSEVVCARADLDLDELVDLVLGRRIGCVPVIDADGSPIGMVTKQDLVELMDVAVRRSDDAYPRTARDVMMPLAFTLDEHATVAHAAAMMATESIHHVVMVANSGCVIGIVSSFDVVRWLATNDGYVRTGDS